MVAARVMAAHWDVLFASTSTSVFVRIEGSFVHACARGLAAFRWRWMPSVLVGVEYWHM